GSGGIAIRANNGTSGRPIISWQAGSTEYGYDYVGTDRKRYFNVNGGDRVVIDTGGNVGIGTASPGTKFVVSGGTATFLGSGSAPIQWGDTSSVGALSYSSSDVILRNQTANAIVFQ